MAQPATMYAGYARGSQPARQQLLSDWQLQRGKPFYVGQGSVPMLDAGQQRFLQRYASAYNPAAAVGNDVAGGGGGGDGGGGGGGGGGLEPFQPGPIQQLMDNFLRQSISGGGTGPASSLYGFATGNIPSAFALHSPSYDAMQKMFLQATGDSPGGGPGAGTTLRKFSRGKTPQVLQQDFRNRLAQSQAGITEGMGQVGNRFGTDIANTLSRSANEANVSFSAEAMNRALQAVQQITGMGQFNSNLDVQMNQNDRNRALQAIQQIIGLGTGQGSLEFTGGQAALDRAHQELMLQLQQSSFSSLLPLLLGAGSV